MSPHHKLRREGVPSIPTRQHPHAGHLCWPHTHTEGVPHVPTAVPSQGWTSPLSPHPQGGRPHCPHTPQHPPDRTSLLSPPSSPPRQDIPAVPTPYTGERHARGPRRCHPRSAPPPLPSPGYSPAAATPAPAHLPRPRATRSVGGPRGRRALPALCSAERHWRQRQREGGSRASPPHAPASPPAGQ